MDKTLKNLPPPPKGQVGVTLESLSHLPSPPKGQTGMTLEQVQKSMAAPQDIESKLRANPSYGSQVGAEQVAGVKKIGGSIAKGAADIKQGTQKGGFSGAGQAIKGVAEAGFGTITGAAQTGFAWATPAISKLVSAITPYERARNPELAQLYDTIAPKLNDIASKHPDGATLTSDIVNTLLLGIGGGASEGAVKEAAGEALTKEGFNAAKSDVASIPGKLANAARKTIDIEGEAASITRKKVTTAYEKLAADQGRYQDKGILGKRTIAQDTDEKAMAKAVEPLVKEGKISNKMSPIEKQKILDGEAKNINEKVKNALKDPKNNRPFNNKTLDKKFNDLKSNRDIGFAGDENSKRTYDAVYQKFKSFIKSNDTKGLFDARQNFDTYMKQNYPGAFKMNASGTLDPVNNAINNAFYDIRDLTNDSIGEAFPEYKPQMKQESGLIRASDTVGQKELVGTTGTNKIGRGIKKVNKFVHENPYTSALIGVGADKAIKQVTGIGF